MISLLVLSFFVAAFAVMVFMRRARRHARRYGADMPQRFHKGHVPRLGGAGIFLGMGAAWMTAGWYGDPFNVGWPVSSSALMLLCIAPAVIGGITEDVTQRVSVRYRLGLTLGSALLLCWLLRLGVYSTGIGLVDKGINWVPYGAVLLAVVAMGGLPHAFNIIDGYNGLAATVAVLVCVAISHVALQVGDRQLAAMMVCLIGATLGFLMWNYPSGKIFAGDGGAYVWGLVIAVACVTLVQRHPLVSPWFPMLLLIYPVWETLFSIYRKVARGQSPGTADALHFHQLIFRRIVRVAFSDDEARQLLSRNNRTSPYLWMFAALSIVPAVLFWNNTILLMIFCGVFVATYVTAYLMIVRFKVPRWLRP
ncbi:glycosyltransferase family 4 protein [Variovorax ginsengisoli]|uniref:UDP-N-acetylmuramyl pentapeptide phosphotransferase/UDP-N-acetylglucosamine-1-phosphate transferase n=1 Tax=Variovorax ginsengisoli TaxID=363844 RepID=A0ABT9SCJ8_9BURK|nr:glycosyltransferase [Variovorax ginsengisoli]MDP9901578.1 UDP-N-acetylmuramyl pentapeptide phosphotransferase/UDP-N-acetylglucosamine-1-phosphate transferase [Variovorax ginsengisoli]